MSKSTKPKLSYTSRSYENIYEDLINSIPSLTTLWTNRDENDPGIVLVKLMAALGDNIAYYLDNTALETHPSTVSQRKNARELFRLIGYRLRGYRSSYTYVTITNKIPDNLVNTSTEVNSIFVNKYSTLTTSDGSLIYTIMESAEIPAGKSATVLCVEGRLVSTTFSCDKIDSNDRFYFPIANADESHLSLQDDTYSWTPCDNVTIHNGSDTRAFEFGIDEYDLPYIQLVPYWRDLLLDKKEASEVFLKLNYLKSSGSSGRIEANSLVKFVTGKPQLTNTIIVLSHPKSEGGYDPESPNDARKIYGQYIHTLDTIVTLTDLENAVKKLDTIANCRATDKMYDPTVSKPYTAKLYLVQDYDYRNPSNNVSVVNEQEYDQIYGELILDISEYLKSYKVASWKLYGIDANEPMSLSAPLFADWSSNIVLYLYYPVTKKVSDELRLAVLNNLLKEFRLSQVSFSTPIDYTDVMRIVLNTDRELIKSANIGPIIYKSNDNFDIPPRDSFDDEDEYWELYYKRLITIPRYMPFDNDEIFGDIVVNSKYIVED